jgi:hypothetical protein
MRNDRLRFRLQLVGSLLSIVVAAAAALGMRDRVRLVDILALFAGGVGAGVALAQMAQAARAARAVDEPAGRDGEGGGVPRSARRGEAPPLGEADPTGDFVRPGDRGVE